MKFSTRMIQNYNSIVMVVFDIICKDWDPLDILHMDPGGSLSRNEYSFYLPKIIKILLSDLNENEVEMELIKIVADMHEGNVEDVVRFPTIVKKMLRYRPKLKKYYQLAQKELSQYSEQDFERLEKLQNQLNLYCRLYNDNYES